MLNPKLKLNKDFENSEKNSTREGFGKGILEAAKKNKKIVAITADLAGSTKLGDFIKKYPLRFVQCGVAEQNLATTASGMAHLGKIPFITSFAAFNPGRNWEQIRTTIAYNNQNVKIIGSHGGLGVGEDGATHQALEDIAIMRVIPNMNVVVPCDFEQAKKATIEISKTKKPTYMRVHRQKSPIITTKKTPFEIGKLQIIKEGSDIALISYGPQVFDCVMAANQLEKQGKSVLVANCHTIKPLHKEGILEIAKKVKAVVVVEDHQIAAGLGGAIAEYLSEVHPTKIIRMGIPDKFGESGNAEELYEKYGLVTKKILDLLKSLQI